MKSYVFMDRINRIYQSELCQLRHFAAVVPSISALDLGRRIVDICTEVLNVLKATVLVEFTVHTGNETLREGEWANDRTPAEAFGR
jgi:hypothetical protein